MKDGKETLASHGDEGLVSLDPEICTGTGMAADTIPSVPAEVQHEEATA